MKAILSSLAEWVFGRHQSFEEYYLSKSVDLADLERRQKELQRTGFRMKYWI